MRHDIATLKRHDIVATVLSITSLLTWPKRTSLPSARGGQACAALVDHGRVALVGQSGGAGVTRRNIYIYQFIYLYIY